MVWASYVDIYDEGELRLHLWYGRVTFTFMVRASYVYIYGTGELRLHLWYGRVTFTNLQMFVNTHRPLLSLSYFTLLCRHTGANRSRPDRTRADQNKLTTLRYRSVWCRNSVSICEYSSAILASVEATVENNVVYAYRFIL